jgi:glycosyltransferase involved in cell wall biosynthesis
MSESRDRLVSIVMPARDEAEFIADAIASVRAQTYPKWELLVVDDGSTDATAAIAADLGATVISQAPQGPAAARNAGLARAAGEYWTIFDADDLMPPDRLRHQTTYLATHPDDEIVFGLTEAFSTPGQPRPPHWNPAWDAGAYHGHPGTAMARATLLATVGPFDESFSLGEDVEWQVRARRLGTVMPRIDELCLRYRVHAGNATSDIVANRTATLRALRAASRTGRPQ